MEDAIGSASAAGSHSREYTLKLAGPHELQKDRFIATFPLGPPGFREKRGRSTWSIAQEEAQFIAPQRGVSMARRTAAPQEWVLTEQPGGAQHRGSVEASMTRQTLPATNSAGALQPAANSGQNGGQHFLLVKHGSEFSLRPVGDWYTFRPVNTRRGQHTLEQAEAQMSSRSSARPLRAPPRLQQLAIADPVDEEAMAGGVKASDSDHDSRADNESGNESDDGQTAQKKKKSKGGQGGPAVASMEASEAAGGRDAGGSGSPSTRTGRGGGGTEGDWEFEDDRADDDLDMDPEEDAPPDDAKDAKKQKDAMSDEEAPQVSDNSSGGGDASDVLTPGETMEKLLARERADDDGTGGGGSDEESALSDESDGLQPLAGYADDDFDDEDDEAMLEKMDRAEASATQRPAPSTQKAQEPPPRNSKSRSRTPDVRPKPQESTTSAVAAKAVATEKGRQKRKATPVGDSVAGKKAKRSGDKSSASPAKAPPSAAPPTQPPTQSEMVEWLRAAGPVSMADFTKAFKRRLHSTAEKQTFAKMFKAIAVRKEIPPGSGIKLLVLQQP